MRACARVVTSSTTTTTIMGGDTKKGKAPAAKASSHQQHDLKTEEVLQALILADSFDQRFTPITLEKPRVSIHISTYLSIIHSPFHHPLTTILH